MQIKKKNQNDSESEGTLRKLKVTEDGIDTGNTIFHQAEEYINRHYELRFNEISLEVEWKSKVKDRDKWAVCNENSLWIEIQKSGIKIGLTSLKALLKSDYVLRYNPLKSYFKSLPSWDGKTDFISQFSDYIELGPLEDREQFQTQFKKWCVRVVKCAIIKGHFNKQALILSGETQNIGKSTWCRFLCPSALSKYIAEDFSSNDKDTRLLLCKNILINLDELAGLSKREINQLKSLFSKDQINERLPYDSKNTILPRVASFLGSTNRNDFLYDETGSVRWLCFEVIGIDWSYKQDFDIDNLWAQAYALSLNKDFDAEMTKPELELNELRNSKFLKLTQERELLQKYYEPSDIHEGVFMTTTEIVEEIRYKSPLLNINSIQMGKALSFEKFKPHKVQGVKGYYVNKKNM